MFCGSTVSSRARRPPCGTTVPPRAHVSLVLPPERALRVTRSLQTFPAWPAVFHVPDHEYPSHRALAHRPTRAGFGDEERGAPAAHHTITLHPTVRIDARLTGPARSASPESERRMKNTVSAPSPRIFAASGRRRGRSRRPTHALTAPSGAHPHATYIGSAAAWPLGPFADTVAAAIPVLSRRPVGVGHNSLSRWKAKSAR